MAPIKTHHLEDLPDNYLYCRLFSHAPDDADFVETPTGSRQDSTCVSCGVVRHDTFDMQGRLESRSYTYPPAYQLSFDAHKDDLRTERLRRQRLGVYVRLRLAKKKR